METAGIESGMVCVYVAVRVCDSVEVVPSSVVHVCCFISVQRWYSPKLASVFCSLQQFAEGAYYREKRLLMCGAVCTQLATPTQTGLPAIGSIHACVLI